MIRRLMMWSGGLGILAALTPVGAAAPAVPEANRPVVELRQYKLVPRARDAFISMFDSKFVDSQEDAGIRVIGQFRDHDRPDRFTWIREFVNMQSREKALNAFYFGPVWQANRAAANPMLDDNDNVLLLRPARPGSGFASSPSRSIGNAGRPGVVIATIEYVWKDPNERFSSFFLDQIAPTLRSAGLPLLGAYVPEEQPNNFPRLPVRQGEKVFVWFTRADSVRSYDQQVARLSQSAAWRRQLAARLNDFRERSPQVLRLDATPRSALR